MIDTQSLRDRAGYVAARGLGTVMRPEYVDEIADEIDRLRDQRNDLLAAMETIAETRSQSPDTIKEFARKQAEKMRKEMAK